MKIRWTRPARDDLIRIQDYIAQDNPRAAFWVVETIRERAGKLVEHPRSGRTGRVEGTRELVAVSYTHLDVYKRQSWLSPIRLISWPIGFLSLIHI